MGLLLDHRQQGKARLLVLNVIDISTILMIYNYFYNKCIFFTTFSPNFSIPGTSALPWILPGNFLALYSDAIVTRGRFDFGILAKSY